MRKCRDIYEHEAQFINVGYEDIDGKSLEVI